MASEKVDWQCPKCRQTWKIREGSNPDHCPDCKGHPHGKHHFQCPYCEQSFWIKDGVDPEMCPQCEEGHRRKLESRYLSIPDPPKVQVIRPTPSTEEHAVSGKKGEQVSALGGVAFLAVLACFGWLVWKAFSHAMEPVFPHGKPPLIADTPPAEPVREMSTPQLTGLQRFVIGTQHQLVGNDVVYVVQDSAAESELYMAAKAHDAIGIAELVSSGRVMPNAPGTTVLILSHGWEQLEVRILSGQWIGRKGWVMPGSVAL